MIDAVVTLVIGDSWTQQWEKYFRTPLAAYVGGLGCPLIVIDDYLDDTPVAKQRWPAWQKLLIFRHPKVAQCHRVLYLDSDIFVTPQQDNPANYVDAESFGGVTENANGVSPLNIRHIHIQRRLPPDTTMINTGMLVLPNTPVLCAAMEEEYFKDVEAREEYEKRFGGWYEQPFLSSRLQRELVFAELPVKFNKLIYMDVNRLGRQQAYFTSLMLQQQFVHCAGEGRDEENLVMLQEAYTQTAQHWRIIR